MPRRFRVTVVVSRRTLGDDLDARATLALLAGQRSSVDVNVSVWEPDAFIHHLYVRNGWRQKGIGKQLLNALDTRFPKPWRLKCLRANDKALAFYLRHGWLEISSGESDDGPYALLERT